MSIHKSLAVGGVAAKKRNVLTRRERIELLKKEGKWGDHMSPYGLPKTKIVALKVKKKAKEEKKPEEAAPEAAASTQEASKEEKK